MFSIRHPTSGCKSILYSQLEPSVISWFKITICCAETTSTRTRRANVASFGTRTIDCQQAIGKWRSLCVDRGQSNKWDYISSLSLVNYRIVRHTIVRAWGIKKYSSFASELEYSSPYPYFYSCVLSAFVMYQSGALGLKWNNINYWNFWVGTFRESWLEM